jgi:hypothetical protein
VPNRSRHGLWGSWMSSRSRTTLPSLSLASLRARCTTMPKIAAPAIVTGRGTSFGRIQSSTPLQTSGHPSHTILVGA